MLRSCRLVPVALVLAGVLRAAAAPPIAGRWNCAAIMPDGGESKWVLTVQQEDGKLAGRIQGERGDFALIDPRFENGAFSFQFEIDAQTYQVRVKVRGAMFEGTWEGGGAAGAVRGAKAD